MMPERARRSCLFLPASNPRAVEKARTLDADVVILDLEDSVAPEAKADARASAVVAAGLDWGRRELVVRVNGLDGDWGWDDVAALSAVRPAAVLVPKVEAAEAVSAVRARTGGAVWAMVETARAVLRLEEIAGAADALVLGPNDLRQSLRLRGHEDRVPLHPVMTMAVAAARAHGRLVFDGVYNDFRDEIGFVAECGEAARFGFDGKTLIHPVQIGPCNRAFSPGAAEVAWAERVVAAFAAPEAEGKGAIQVDGRMVERLHLKDAERVLAGRG